MRIGINGFEAVIPRFGYDKNGLPNRVGSSEVCFELLVNLEKIDKKNNYIIYLPVAPTFDMPQAREGWEYKIVKKRPLWTLFGLTPALAADKSLDVFFSPTHYGPLFISIPQVISVLDTSYKYFPELFKKRDLYQLAIWGSYSIKKAKNILTISESAKSDIIREYNVPEEKVTVVHLGIKELNSKMDKKELSRKYSLDKPYILFVGTLQPRKNISRLIEAFSRLGMKDLDLVIIGRRGWMFEEILNAPSKFGVSESVKFLENVTDEELPAFYKNAELFVLPSLYEGFGLPILEAMKFACPVVTSNISSLPEAGGDAAIYFDPEDTGDITEKMKKVLGDSKLRSDMIKKGHEQVKKFSWDRAAKEVIEVLEKSAAK